jgi:signal transduction histidine kinase
VALNRNRVELSALAREIIGELRADQPERDVEVRVADGLLASGDPHLLRLALTNLLANAWKFTSNRRHATIDFGRYSQGDRAGTVVFYIRDNGAGFNMDYAGKLFEPFQRLHSAAEFPGNGLGLAIVQRIIRRHGGQVWAESRPGSGATFFFTMTRPEDPS